MYNYLPDQPKLALSIASAMAGLWALFFHFVFNYLNAKNDYRLMRFWMKLTLELPVKSDQDYKVMGLSRKENKAFWTKENYFNRLWNRTLNCYIVCIGFTFSSLLFLVKLSMSLIL